MDTFLAAITLPYCIGITDAAPLKTSCSLVEFDLFALTLELFLLIKLHHHPLKWACDYPHFIAAS